MWRSALVIGVFVAVGSGVALFLGEASLIPVFVALGVVTALGERRRWKQAAANGDAAQA
jgi:drug/metabolite transporter (DMT)-like permease